MAPNKDDLVRIVMDWLSSGDIEDKVDNWQDLSGYITGFSMITDKDVVRIVLEELNSRGLLVPLILSTFIEGIIDWKYVDTISGGYSEEIAPSVLSKLRKADLRRIIEYYNLGD